MLGGIGQHRRIYNFEHFPELALPWMFTLRHIATVALLVMLLFQVVFFYNVITVLDLG